jgi:glutathione S-transferase
MSLTVYGYPNTRTLRVTWALEELGLDYDYHLVDLSKGETKSEPYLALNPGGKVPTLVTEGGAITESLAIINYLVALKPESELIPRASPYRRACYDQWSIFALAELEQPLWTIGKSKFALPAEYRVSEIQKTAEYEFQLALSLLSSGLGANDYILGSEFSAADIVLAHTLFWGLSFKQKIDQENLKAYIGRMGVRPALSLAREREKSALPSA